MQKTCWRRAPHWTWKNRAHGIASSGHHACFSPFLFPSNPLPRFAHLFWPQWKLVSPKKRVRCLMCIIDGFLWTGEADTKGLQGNNLLQCCRRLVCILLDWLTVSTIRQIRCDWGVGQSFVFSEIRKKRYGSNSKRGQVGAVTNQVSVIMSSWEASVWNFTCSYRFVPHGKRFEHLLLNPWKFYSRSDFCNHPFCEALVMYILRRINVIFLLHMCLSHCGSGKNLSYDHCNLLQR